MKSVLSFLVLFAVSLACTNKADLAAPDAATRVAGTYDVTSVQSPVLGSYTYPHAYTSLAGKVITQTIQLVAVRQTGSSVELTVTSRETDQPDQVALFGTLDIRGTELYRGTAKLGTADGITLVFTDVSGTVTARKR